MHFSLSCAPEENTGHKRQRNERVSIYQLLVRLLRQTYSPAVMIRCLRFFFGDAGRCELEASMTDESHAQRWNIFTFQNMPNVSRWRKSKRGRTPSNESVSVQLTSSPEAQPTSTETPQEWKKKKDYTGPNNPRQNVQITARGRWFVNWLKNLICHPVVSNRGGYLEPCVCDGLMDR